MADDRLDHAVETLAATLKEDLLPLTVGEDLGLSQSLFRAWRAATIVGGETYLAQQEDKVTGVVRSFGPGEKCGRCHSSF